MNGHEYKRLVARYLLTEYASRGLRIYDEVSVGTSIIGKPRRIDLFLFVPELNRAAAVECKYQDVAGTADEKIPYTLQDLKALRMPAVVAYAGSGFSEGVLHLLQSSEYAAYCLPDPSFASPAKRKGEGTWQLDHVLAMIFGWWDVILRGKTPIESSYQLELTPRAGEPGARDGD